jgi:hypothetical protein
MKEPPPFKQHPTTFKPLIRIVIEDGLERFVVPYLFQQLADLSLSLALRLLSLYVYRNATDCCRQLLIRRIKEVCTESQLGMVMVMMVNLSIDSYFPPMMIII